MKEFVKAKAGVAVDFWKEYEHRLGIGALIAGFFFDLVIADSPDNLGNNIFLLSYLFIAGAIIILLNIRTRRQMEQESPAEPLLLLLILQFCFGGLASNLLVLYGKSGTFTGSAFFIALLVCLLFGNEYLRSRYSQLRFNIITYYFLLLTYCIIAAPTFIFHSIGIGSFLLSGALSLVAIALYLALLYLIVLRKKTAELKDIGMYVLIVFVIFNGLYFLNVIPPVPLSLKDIGVYHSILKYSSGNYLALYESPPWYEFWHDTNTTFRYTQGQSAYCFSSVYAPADLDTPIDHKWEHYNEASNTWDTVSRISFPISGGRAAGYRGFSATAALSPGQWRCNVETQGGALIGRTTFNAVVESSTPTLSQTTL
ncbi:MAG: DUF2914 domain-containing protein [bacterium]|nr:DUF2914 domain-containing protein [bacterium]